VTQTQPSRVYRRSTAEAIRHDNFDINSREESLPNDILYELSAREKYREGCLRITIYGKS